MTNTGTPTSSLNREFLALCGRESELERIILGVGPGDDGTRFVWVRGDSGIGKTVLVETAARDSRITATFDVIRINGRGGTSGRSCAPLIEAFPDLQAVLRSAVNTSGTSSAALELARCLSHASQRRSQLVVIDDIQALDASSIAVLSALEHLDSETNVSVVIIEQIDAPASFTGHKALLEQLYVTRIVTKIEVDRLADASIEKIVSHAFSTNGIEPDKSSIKRLVQRSDGNPGFAVELAFSTVGGSIELPTTIVAAARIRLAAMSDLVRFAVRTVALHPGPMPIEWLRAIIEEEGSVLPDDLMSALASIGVTVRGDEFLCEPHPLIRLGIVESMLVPARRLLHRGIAHALSGLEESAAVCRWIGHHRLAAGDYALGMNAMSSAAIVYSQNGLMHDAIHVNRLCAEATQSADDRIAFLKRSVQIAVEIGSPARNELIEELLAAAQSAHNVDALACALIMRAWVGNSEDASRDIERAAALDPERSAWSARAVALQLQSVANDAVAQHKAEEQALRLAVLVKDHWLEAIVCERLGISSGRNGAFDKASEYFDRAILLGMENHMHDSVVGCWINAAEVAHTHLNIGYASSLHATGIQHCHDSDLEYYLPLLSASQAQTLNLLGEFAAAREVIQHHVDLPLGYNPADVAMVRYSQALVALELHDAEAAVVAVDRFVEAAGILQAAWVEIHIVYIQAMLCKRLGQIERARLAIASLPETENEPEMASLAVWCARCVASRPDDLELEVALESLLTAARRCTSTPLVQLAIEEIEATISAIKGSGHSRLLTLSERWMQVGRKPDALRCATSHAFFALSAAKTESATEQALELLSGLHTSLRSIGMLWDADEVAGMLRQHGRFARASNRVSGEMLSDRDRQVVALVQLGLSNAEIAERMSVTVSAIGVRLWKMYERTGTNSRTQLLNWIDANA